MTLPAELVNQVRQRAQFACEYCGVTEVDSGGQLTVDHHQPRSWGGPDSLENLLYCCYRCNLYKADYWPQAPGDPVLWGPSQGPRESHLLALADGRLHPTSAVGQFTLQRLRLNRPQLVAYRLRKRSLAAEEGLLQQQESLLRSLKQLQEQLAGAVQEHQKLLRTLRDLLSQWPEGPGRRNGEERPAG